ncbi:hypothetical protein X766_16060 [Mesorhizobium sp. LSJC255A00]|uniref:hypothetical protein n=1 Tax=Mesorhizobium sp. LSJC255A00 TaxID=1287313 RepID=UPI0003CF977B|nr:hypothetical protein [Mesorhizobium sp. LSJC255A00]ESX17902.1 hypothetical protein X766_16060 [Mesorhizobium sp. LSJC255A00]
MNQKVKTTYHRLLAEHGFIINGEAAVPPAGMGEFTAADIIQRCWLDAQIEANRVLPHWHDQNPWNDRLMYVPIEELAECFMGIGRLVHLNDNEVTMCDVAFVLQNWAQYGDKLDAYILTGPLTTASIRFGPEGPDYLSPGFSLPKLRALMLKYGSQKRKSA